MRFSGGISTPSNLGMVFVKKVTKLNRKSALALFMARVFADHAHHVLALYDLATGTKSFYRWSYFHSPQNGQRGACSTLSFMAKRDSPLRQIVGRNLNHNFVPSQDANE